MAQRLRFEVRKLRDGGSWGLFSPAELVQWRDNKRAVVMVASGLLTRLYYELRVRSELIIKRADGTIQDTRTYGDDPRRTKG